MDGLNRPGSKPVTPNAHVNLSLDGISMKAGRGLKELAYDVEKLTDQLAGLCTRVDEELFGNYTDEAETGYATMASPGTYESLIRAEKKIQAAISDLQVTIGKL